MINPIMMMGRGSGVPPINGLIAYWKFANGADTTEYTGTYNLTKTGTPTIGTDRLGNTAGFSGFTDSNYFSHPTFIDSGLTAWTFFTWLKITGTTTEYIFHKTNSSVGAPFVMYYDGVNRNIGLMCSDGSVSVTSTSTVNTGNWFLLVISGDSSGKASLSMNINGGASEGTITGTGTDSGSIIASTDFDFSFGKKSNGTGTYFVNGSIGECGFCNRVLTASEKIRIYNESSAQYIVPNILIP